MKLLRQMLDQAEPAFKKGAPLERLYPAFEMIDTFLYTPADEEDCRGDSDDAENPAPAEHERAGGG